MRTLLFFFLVCFYNHAISASYLVLPVPTIHNLNGAQRLHLQFHPPIQTGSGWMSTTNRKLLQTTDCEWNNNTQQCMPAEAETLAVISRSGNPTARFLTTVYDCILPKDEEACNEVGHCFWNKVDERCVYADWSLSHKDSPCLKNAPMFSEYVKTEIECSAEETEKECGNATVNCLWNAEESGCKSDHFLLLFGVSGKEFEGAMRKLLPVAVDDAFLSFDRSYNASDPDFEWEDVLTLNVSVMDCFNDTHPNICAYIQGIAQAVVPPSAYCFGKYGFRRKKKCSANTLCDFDKDLGCKMSESLARRAGSDLLRELDFNSEYPMDRRIFKMMLTCSAQDNKADCSGFEDCVWNRVGRKCETGSTMYGMLSSMSNDTNDEFCAGMTFQAQNNCSDHDEEDCIVAEQCEYRNGVCGRSVEASVDAVLKDDANLKRRWKKIDNKCRKQRSRRACLT